jgi:beta-glucanase (GH16 family)
MPSAAFGITQDGWRVEVEEGKSARSTLTINNRCSAPHLFRIKSEAGFLRFEQATDSVLIEAGSSKRLVVRLDAAGLKGKTHRGKVVVECIDCKKEPGCNQNRDELPVEMIVIGPRPIATPPVPDSIKGRVVDPRNNPVAGVQVRVPGRSVVLTDGKGEFDIWGLPAVERLAVNFSAPGFMDTTRIYNSRRSSVGTTIVVIRPRTAPVSLDAERGGKLTFPGGTINFPPRALVDEAGRAVSGNVRVSFSALDVSDRQQIRSAPGDFTARMRDNKIRRLETFGVFEVFVEDANGRRANLAPGRKAAVELFIPRALRRTVPSSVGLFSFEQSSGRWVEEGTLRTAPDLTRFTTSINRLTTAWNADQVLSTTCIKLKILDCAGPNCGLPSGLAGSYVEAYGVGYAGFSDGYTDGNGEICLSVKLNAQVSVTAHHPTLSNIQSNPIEITTPSQVASDADCGTSLCPLVATTHLASAGFFNDLNAHDTLAWCTSEGWANGDPAFNVGWRDDHINFSATPGKMRLALNNYADDPNNPCCMTTTNPCSIIGNACSDKPFAAGQYRSKCFYGYGTYEATFKTGAPRGSGFVTTFFTYTDEYDGTYDGSTRWHDEIDVEILSRLPDAQLDPQEAPCQPNDTVMQTNYFVKGVGGHEHKTCLNFDASAAEHTYRFVWSDDKIEWYVDPATNTIPVWTETRVGNAPWPTQPGRIYVNLWSGSCSADPWLGPFIYPGTPIYAEYNSIQHIPQ